MKLLISSFFVGSSYCRPPRSWNAMKEDDVDSCTIPPQVGGEWFTHVNVQVFAHTETTGGLFAFLLKRLRGRQ